MTMDTTNQDVWDAKSFLTYWVEVHPSAQVQDYVKRIYQSEFGGGHMIQSEEESLALLKDEIAHITDKQKRRRWFDPFCGDFCRMHLSISKELSPELMNRIFVVSSRQVLKGAWFRFEEKLRIFWELCQEQAGHLAFTPEEAAAYLKWYRDANYPMVSHSDAYRKAYEPAYRVIRKEYGRYPTLYSAVEKCLREKGSVNVAIDGNSAAGKSNAAKMLSDLFDANVFHTDDYFLPLEKRTPERLAEVGGNMDRERFKAEICEGVKSGKPFTYRPFDCSVMKMGEPVAVEPKKVNIFEGSYSMHPDLREYYDVKVFLSVSPNIQAARILERNGSFMIRRFIEEWIPKENAYFQQMKVKESADLIF